MEYRSHRVSPELTSFSTIKLVSLVAGDVLHARLNCVCVCVYVCVDEARVFGGWRCATCEVELCVCMCVCVCG